MTNKKIETFEDLKKAINKMLSDDDRNPKLYSDENCDYAEYMIGAVPNRIVYCNKGLNDRFAFVELYNNYYHEWILSSFPAIHNYNKLFEMIKINYNFQFVEES